MLWSLITTLRDLTQQLKRIADTMPTLIDALSGLKTAVQAVVADDATKDATIADLQTKLAASEQAEADAKANEASPDVIAEIQADTATLQAALHAVQNTPAASAAPSTPVTPLQAEQADPAP